jgi:uridine monophosphate synthetase
MSTTAHTVSPITIAGIPFHNNLWNCPVPLDFDNLLAIARSPAGAIVTKSITLRARKGHPTAVALKGNSSVNNIGLHNKGIHYTIGQLKELRRHTTKPIILSVYGQPTEVEDIIAIVRKRMGTIAYPLLIEWNISCPNVKDGVIAHLEPKQFTDLRAKAKPFPLGVKLSYQQAMDEKFQLFLARAQPSFITAINTFYGAGGRYIADKALEAVKKLVALPFETDVVAAGGASLMDKEGRELVEKFLGAGAKAVAMGTAFLRWGTKAWCRASAEGRDEWITCLASNRQIVYRGENIKGKSGVALKTYIDGRSIPSFPLLWHETIDRMIVLLHEHNLVGRGATAPIDCIVGVPYGALPLATALAQRLSLPLLTLRKEKKKHGRQRILEGHYHPGWHVLMVEDVITTGSSLAEAAALIWSHGLKIQEMCCLVDRRPWQQRHCGSHILSLSVMEDFEERPSPPASRFVSLPQHPIAKRIRDIIMKKRTNLCLAADMTNPDDMLSMVAKLGQFICMVKTHWDQMEFKDTSHEKETAKALHALADKHMFLLFEDRKLLEIGAVVRKQWKRLTQFYKPNAVTVHCGAGDGAVRAVAEETPDIGIIVVAQLSTLHGTAEENNQYTRTAISLARRWRESVCALVAQERLDSSFLHMTPGIKKSLEGINMWQDNQGQRWRSPGEVHEFADVLIVGRALWQADNPVEVAKSIIAPLVVKSKI